MRVSFEVDDSLDMEILHDTDPEGFCEVVVEIFEQTPLADLKVRFDD